MKKLNYLMFILTICSIMNYSCKSDPTTTSYSVRMTDAPGPYDAVNVDVQAVEITGNGGTTVALNVKAGIYNLLSLSNGIDTLIATADLKLTSVEQIRLILGSNNTVVVSGVSYPLSTPSAEQSGLKLQVNQKLQPGVDYAVLLDFDAKESIVETGNGQYKLKPVLRTIEIDITGSVKGELKPKGTIAFVTAFSNGVYYSSAVNSDGKFKIKGLPAGTYSVTVTPASPLLPITVNNVIVTVGTTTDIGITQF